MNELTPQLKNNSTDFEPGQSIEGTITWDLQREPEKLTLALAWYTESRATTESGLADKLELTKTGQSGSQDFSFAVPAGPYSFAGKHLSIKWTLELSAGGESVARELVIGPANFSHL